MSGSVNEFELFGLNRRTWLQTAAIAAAFPFVAHANSSSLGDEDIDDEEDEDSRFKTTIDTNLIGDHTAFGGWDAVVLEGVGLVRGLSGTGGDPSPSPYRTSLLDDLKKKGYRYPNAIMQSPDTAMVLVRAYLKPLMKKGDRLDVSVTIPGVSNATSLVGGELVEVHLSDRANVDGRYMVGRVYAVARGPVLTDSLGASKVTELVSLRKGRVLGGGIVTKERELFINLKNDFRSFRNARRIETAIGKRFHDFDEHGIKAALAKAKSDQQLVLKIHPRYNGNPEHFTEVIRHMAFTETPVELRVRMNRLKHDLCVPEMAASSALQLEAIGVEAIPTLKHGLTAPMLECRFHAANALAYLGDSSGVEALLESAKKERAFRVFALASLASIEDASAHVALKELMNEPNEELRYGAFRALWTLDRNEPFIRGETLGIREAEANHDYEYKLHVLDTAGPPLVHVSLRTRPEIVVFNGSQEISAPMNASAGKHIMVVAQPGATTTSVVRFEAGKQDERREVSLRVAYSIRAVNDLGATYPDVVQLLVDASNQKNLPNSLAIDKLPEPARVYYRPDAEGKHAKGRPVRIGRENQAPSAFPKIDDPEEAAAHRQQAARDAKIESEGTMGSVPTELNDSSSPPQSKLEPVGNKKISSKSSKKKSSSKSKSAWSWFGNKK